MPERGHPVKCPPSFPDAGRTFGCGAVLARGGSEPGFPDPGPPTRGTVPRFPPKHGCSPSPSLPPNTAATIVITVTIAAFSAP